MILIIDNYDSFTYNLYQAVAQLHTEVTVYRNDKITVNNVQRMNPQGIILSPGPGRPENAGICIELIRTLIHHNIKTPLLGVCLGHQAITVAMGGNVVHANEVYHGKSDFIFHNRSQLYKNLPLPFEAGRYHSLIADKATLPDTLLIEAETASGMIMGIRHHHLPLFGVQFHPESILTPQGTLLLQQFVEYCKQNHYEAAA